MSRSRRKTPFIPVAVTASDKTFKMAEHRRERRYTRAILSKHQDSDDRRLHSQVFGDTWHSNKDGKCYWGRDAGKLMRK